MCGYREFDRYQWVSTRGPDMRVSQADRDRVVERLRTHAGEGRLELDELEERVGAALAAKTRRDLEPLLADLPRERARRRNGGGAVRTVALGSLASALLPLMFGIAVIALAPPAFTWIGWTALGWWFFMGLPSAGLGFAWCGWSRRRRERRAVVV